MKYYLHDSNAFQDEKITELFINFGYEGLGLFYTILEKLASQEKPIKTDVLKHQLKVGKRLEKCWSFMEALQIISSNNGETFNKQLLNFSEKYKIKSEKNAKRISQWREKQSITENVTRYESVRNTSKVNRSKVKEIEVNKYTDEIKNFTAELTKFFNIDLISKLSQSDKINWIDTIDKLIKLDKYSKAEIEKAVKNATHDQFWAKQFLSLVKLRKKDKDGVSYISKFLQLNHKVEPAKKINPGYMENPLFPNPVKK